MKEIVVLVVDDEEDFLHSIVRRLRLRNVQAHGVPGGREALAFLPSNPVDVVVLDVKMPGLDGLTTLGEIRARHPGVQVIVLTGHASMDASAKGEKLGAFDYVIKPVRLDQLLKKIEAAGARARGQRPPSPSREGGP